MRNVKREIGKTFNLRLDKGLVTLPSIRNDVDLVTDETVAIVVEHEIYDLYAACLDDE